jgi:ribonuclease BN (tRNA processing enzyme)
MGSAEGNGRMARWLEIIARLIDRRRLGAAGVLAGLVIGGATVQASDTNGPVCPKQGVWVQVLGAGGPEVEDMHASTGYLVWLDGKARVLVDIGGGASLRFSQSQANFADLDVIAISHFHVDHSVGLPVLVKSSFFGRRDRPLTLFGPEGNTIMPSAASFIDSMFAAPKGVYHYLSDFVDPNSRAAYHLTVENVPLDTSVVWHGFKNERFALTAVPVAHGALPALGWRVDIAGRSIAFIGDMSGRFNTMPTLAKGVDLFIAHNAIPEGLDGVARFLHMPP